MPIRLYDEPEELADWARQAVEVAARVRLKKVARKKKSKKAVAAKARAKRRDAKPVKTAKTRTKAGRGVKRK
jgi:DNA transformation protein